jgi:serine/threonine-protein kinase
VTDFGLARRLGQESSLTHSGAVLGTPSYMAPEQASGQGSEVGRSADIYSLGAIFYELLTGRPPFRAPSVVETLILVLERDPIRPGRLRKGIPPEMEAICLKCLEKAPDDRYGSAEALADDVDRALRGDEVQAMSAGIRLRLRRWTRREPQLVSHLIGLGSILALTQFNYLTSRSPDPRLHLLVTAALLAWAGVSVVLQALARRAGRRQAIWPAWAVADSGFLTLSLWLLDGGASSMVVGYPLVIAASGLWFRLSLVWLSTALAEVGYGLLVLDGSLRGILDRQPDHPNIVFASIAVTGFVVARQVKRLQALSSYYEHRLPS